MLNTKNILIGIIIILIGTNIATVLSFNKYHKDTCSHSNKNIKHKWGLGKIFKEELNLTIEQSQKFRKIRHDYYRNAKRIMDNIRIENENFIIELGKNKLDSMKIKQITERIGSEHIQLKNVTLIYYLELKQHCTPEQQKNLNLVFKNLHKFKGQMRFRDNKCKSLHLKQRKRMVCDSIENLRYE